MRIAVNQLGLAAYIKMGGSELVEVEGKTFIFESDKSVRRTGGLPTTTSVLHEA